MKNYYVIFNKIAVNNINYVIFNILIGANIMKNEEMSNIFEQINNLKSPNNKLSESKKDNNSYELRLLLKAVSEEIQRVLDENNFTQEELCKITNMSQSNISKIQNGKVMPRIETLQKIAMATHTRLVISFESMEGEE